MASTLVAGQTHPYDVLALYVHKDGVLVDAVKVEYQVLDVSAGLPGAQLLPIAGGRTEVTSNAGHFATGCYGVFNLLTALPWAPAAAVTRARVAWYVTRAAGEAERVVDRYFEVLAATDELRAQTGLALVQDVRDYGGVAAGTTSKTIHDELMLARDTLERVARQRFRAIRETLRLRGRGMDTMFLAEPLLALSSIVVDSTTFDSASLRVYGEGEDRRNPKVEIRKDKVSIYSAVSTALFADGVPYVMAGVWGFVEPDTLGPPALVRQAALQWVRIVLGERGGAGANPVGGRRIRSETTDRHSITYADGAAAPARPGLESLLRDPVISEAISLYRGPPAIAAAT